VAVEPDVAVAGYGVHFRQTRPSLDYSEQLRVP